MNVRPTTRDDITALQSILDATELFPSDMLPEMIEAFFAKTDGSIWLASEDDGGVTGFCFAMPEELAEGTWNMIALAIAPPDQGRGCGAALTSHLEDVLRATGQRILIVDTSSGETYQGARRLYLKCGFTEEARIRDYWANGDDKITFWKSLT
jgi:ribosomal protein S18 acetylase RimI-like enzyme